MLNQVQLFGSQFDIRPSRQELRLLSSRRSCHQSARTRKTRKDLPIHCQTCALRRKTLHQRQRGNHLDTQGHQFQYHSDQLSPCRNLESSHKMFEKTGGGYPANGPKVAFECPMRLFLIMAHRKIANPLAARLMNTFAV
jgi:hypothetical protein